MGLTTRPPLFGLLLVGGYSKRMGRDKSALNHFGKPWVPHLFKLLTNVTGRAFISCRPDQKEASHLTNFPKIEDTVLSVGPLGGILSAFKQHPSVAWLTVACDMPFLNARALGYLVERRNPSLEATCFFNTQKGWSGPLCTIYEPSAFPLLERHFLDGKKCPRKILTTLRRQDLTPPTDTLLYNINTPEEFTMTQLGG